MTSLGVLFDSSGGFGFVVKASRTIAKKANNACIVIYPLDSILSSLCNWTNDYLGGSYLELEVDMGNTLHLIFYII